MNLSCSAPTGLWIPPAARSNAAVGDLDRDGMGEIVVPSDVHYICAYEANGIQIPARMHTLAAGAAIDFNQICLLFREDYALRQLMAAGRGAGLWNGSRPIRHTAYALEGLYAGLGLTPALFAPSLRESDADGDGKPEVNKVFATGLNRPFGIAFYPVGPEPKYYPRRCGSSDAGGDIPRSSRYL